MARTTTPRRARHFRLIDSHYTGQTGFRLTTYDATAAIRSARKRPATEVAAVNVYACTDRDGEPLHIAYVQHAVDRWSNVTGVADIYEIPTATLTDL